MNKVFQKLSFGLYIAIFAVSLTLTGCSADSLNGPDLGTTETVGIGGGGTDMLGGHNEGEATKGGGGTDMLGGHNEGEAAKGGGGTDMLGGHNEGY